MLNDVTWTVYCKGQWELPATVSERKFSASELTPLDPPPFLHPLITHHTVKIAENTP